MVQAYILVQTEVGKAAEVAVRIGEISGVTQAEDVTGPYDVIVRAEAENVDDLGRLAADPGPNLGRNAVPGRAVYRVVPVPPESGTNACGHRAAARRALPSSAGRSAGRSAASPPIPDRGQRDPACAAPRRSARLSPGP